MSSRRGMVRFLTSDLSSSMSSVSEPSEEEVEALSV